MKKIILVLVTVFLNVTFFSCTPEAIADGLMSDQVCCGEEGNIPPPPPPIDNGE